MMKKLSYHNVAEHLLPGQIRVRIEEQCKEPFTAVFTGEDGTSYVLISLGEKRKGGYSIAVAEVAETAGLIAIKYQELAPAPGTISIQMINYPWKVISIKSTLPITVEKVVELQ